MFSCCLESITRVFADMSFVVNDAQTDERASEVKFRTYDNEVCDLAIHDRVDIPRVCKK